MATYEPDVWAILHKKDDGEDLIKVFAGFRGGFARGDAWKLSSMTTSVEIDKGRALFHQLSGSTYVVGVLDNPPTGWLASVMDELKTIGGFSIITVDQAIQFLSKDES